VTPKQRAAYSISKSLFKKFLDTVDKEADERALSKFRESNLLCRDWSLQLNTSIDEILHGEVRNFIYQFLNRDGYAIADSLDQFFHYGRCGPGASAASRGYDFYTKLFSSPLSCSSHGLYQAYKSYISRFAEWSNAELIRQEHYGPAHITADSRLSFVPKDRSISRTICVEPTLNMFAQLGLGHILESRLKKWGINLSLQQDLNRKLAEIGSMTDRYSTIDLSCASDSISLGLVDALFPPEFSGWLKLLRTKGTILPSGERLELFMVSTMGNGYTFPLQTIIFSAIVLAAMSFHGVKPVFSHGIEPGNFGVNGDDIICPSTCTRTVMRLLSIYGFRVNQDKSFVEGPFRESCGADFFQGINVRGVYLKRLATQQDFCSAINQLNLFSTRTGIMLPTLVRALFAYTKWLPVPMWENEDAGIKVPLSFVGELPTCPSTRSLIYRAWRAVGVRIRIGESALFSPRWLKKRIYNPSGLWISLLQGSVHSCSIGVRHDPVRYKRELSVAPSWDATVTTRPSGRYSLEQHKVAIYRNLFQ
jgi:hypothetical protein